MLRKVPSNYLLRRSVEVAGSQQEERFKERGESGGEGRRRERERKWRGSGWGGGGGGGRGGGGGVGIVRAKKRVGDEGTEGGGVRGGEMVGEGGGGGGEWGEGGGGRVRERSRVILNNRNH